jgi:hypothetical protein
MVSSDLMDTETAVDRTRGRVLVIDGNIFYSPNSSRCRGNPADPCVQYLQLPIRMPLF